MQKDLIKEGESLQKVWETQLDALKKARANYVKAGKDVFLSFFLFIHLFFLSPFLFLFFPHYHILTFIFFLFIFLIL